MMSLLLLAVSYPHAQISCDPAGTFRPDQDAAKAVYRASSCADTPTVPRPWREPACCTYAGRYRMVTTGALVALAAVAPPTVVVAAHENAVGMVAESLLT